MNHSSIGPKPYAKLGEKLKDLRNSSRESLAEVSGAVEIDEHILERFETGMDRPDEEILNLLINHYRLNDRLATQLWELAGYSDRLDDAIVIEEAMAAAKQLIMVLATDGRTIYTDGAKIDCNNKGLVISFTQSAPRNNSVVVSRLGMSYETAADVLKALGVAMT
ncbi:MAG: helix-turn-helix domain-containing protein, partial [Candidatus Saccharimonadales bacterium]